jgi:hypothetical protein
MWADREGRFPEHTPVNKEYYLLRSIFEEYYPHPSALETVPKGLSIACSTPEAVSWDPTWANVHDISGRAVSFHDAADSYTSASEEDSERIAVAARAARRARSTAARVGPMRRPATCRFPRATTGLRRPSPAVFR